MKRKLGILLCLIGLITFVTVSPALAVPAVPNATLGLLDSDIEVGESFNVEVWGHVNSYPDFDEWLSFAFEVTTPGIITWDGYIMGPYFDDDTIFFGGNYVAGSATDVTDQNILLSTLNFTANTQGAGILSVFGDSLSFEGLGIWEEGLSDGFYDINDNIEITVNATPVPVPATMFLLGSGLIGLAGIRRKRKK